MQAAWYEKQGPARDVLVVGEIPDPELAAGELRIRVHASGINPGDVKKRGDAFGIGMPYPRVIPHSDGAGIVDRVGAGVPASRIGERVWCYGAQSHRPFGTAAEYVVVPATQAVLLPKDVSFEQGACLGIPGITAHHAVHANGPVAGRTVLVHGGAGAVGYFAVALARLAGARVIATVLSETDVDTAHRAGADEVVRRDHRSDTEFIAAVNQLAPSGIDHIVEVAFDANIGVNTELIALGGSIGAYASGHAAPSIPFWPLLFKNIHIHFLGSDDFPAVTKTAAAEAINALYDSGWPGIAIAHRFTLEQIAQAHGSVEAGRNAGRVIVQLAQETAT